jgi:hypothetical protein
VSKWAARGQDERLGSKRAVARVHRITPSPPPEEQTIRLTSPVIGSPLPILLPTPPDSNHELDPDSDDNGNELLAYLEQCDHEIDEEEARLAALKDDPPLLFATPYGSMYLLHSTSANALSQQQQQR